MRNVINKDKNDIEQEHIEKDVELENKIKDNAQHKLQEDYEA